MARSLEADATMGAPVPAVPRGSGPLVKKLFALAASFAWLLVVPSPAALATRSDCAPVQAVFYTSGDWCGLPRRSPPTRRRCAQYYISIPPLAAAKTTIRSGAAAQVRSLGPNFHALAEINYSAWQSWVNSTGSTWFEAGEQARTRMASAGFDVSSGDTWVVNEASSSVVAGTGQAGQICASSSRGSTRGTAPSPP